MANDDDLGEENLFAAAATDDIDLPPTAAERAVDEQAAQAARRHDSGEGIFADNANIFTRRRVNHQNPVETVAQERVVEMIPGTAKANPPGAAQLLAVWDNAGRPWVARGVDGNPVEPWRKPTQAEWNYLKTNGSIVRGGLAAAPTTSAPGMSLAAKALIAGVALIAAGGAAYYYVKKREDSMEEDVDELD